MSKKRKTREEKIIAELRHKLEASAPEIVVPKPTFNINTALPNKQNAVLNYDYSYVRRDLIKTILLTIVVVFAFIVLYWGMEIRGPLR